MLALPKRLEEERSNGKSNRGGKSNKTNTFDQFYIQCVCVGGVVALFQCNTNYFEKNAQSVKNTVEQDKPFLQGANC